MNTSIHSMGSGKIKKAPEFYGRFLIAGVGMMCKKP